MPTKYSSKKIKNILDLFRLNYPAVKPALNYGTTFQLLISTMLSAQCTDERVNIVTESLFKKYKSPKDYLKVSQKELEKDIFSTGYYKQKAKNIRACCALLLEKYNGQVPKDFDKLVTLPGIGRKTASVVVGNAFGIPAIAVDTHVNRLSNLLGFVKSKDPVKIEIELKKLIPQSDWTNSSHWLAMHGRLTCIARCPKCFDCFLSNLCPSFNPNTKKQ